MSDLENRNAAIMLQTVERWREELDEFRGKLVQLQDDVSQLRQENVETKQMLSSVLVKIQGSGPTTV